MTTSTINNKISEEIAKKIEEYNSITKSLNEQFGQIVEPETHLVDWGRLYKAMDAGRKDDLLAIGFTEDDLDTARAYNRLAEAKVITDAGIDVEEGVKRGLSGELEQIGVSVDLIDDWQQYTGEI